MLVKRLVAIEDLGDADILFTDKTGTLTEGEIRYREAVDPTGRVGARPRPAGAALQRARLRARRRRRSATRSTSRSGAASSRRSRRPSSRGAGRVATLPFTFERRRTSVVLERAGRRRLLCKGAAEEVLARCTTVRLDGREPLADARAAGRATLAGLLDHGHRLLALAERPIEAKPTLHATPTSSELELLGFLVFADPPKQDAAESIARLQRLGIELKVLTGDNERTAAHVCARARTRGEGRRPRRRPRRARRRASCRELVARDDDLRPGQPRAEGRRSSPPRSATATTSRSSATASTTPSRSTAPTSASRSTPPSTSPRRPPTSLLLEKSLRAIADGVVEGRRIFANTMKYVLMGTSSNFGNMFSAAGASLFLSFLPMLPSQILLNNLLYDCSELTIPTDTVDEELLARPEHWDIGFIRRFMALLRADQLALRLPDLRRHALGLPRARAALSQRLVRRVARDAVARRLRDPHAACPVLPEPPEPAAARDDARGRPGRPRTPYSPLAHALGFRSLPWSSLRSWSR